MAIRVDRIRQLLKTKNISAKKMLSDLNQSPNNLSRWERESTDPSFASVSAIANYLGVDVRYLLGQSDSPYSEDILEDMQDKLIGAGVEIWTWDDDEGVGLEYELSYNGKSYKYQAHEFQNICSKLRSELTDAEISTVDKFCRELFSDETSPIKSETPSLSKEEQDLIDRYRKLNAEGKTMVNATIIQEIRRQE